MIVAEHNAAQTDPIFCTIDKVLTSCHIVKQYAMLLKVQVDVCTTHHCTLEKV